MAIWTHCAAAIELTEHPHDGEPQMTGDHADKTPLQQAAKGLGFAGLLPQSLAVLLALDSASRYVALAAGYFYAALILSFLGGLWWGLAAAASKPPQWSFAAAVGPSLLAFATGVPWMIGTTWPGPSLIVLAVALVASLSVDLRLRRLELMSGDLFALRVRLSLGLGALTLALGLLA
jgi:Protein of unknown function (DUF3429)